jgi:glucose/arabinose dehydrogenase
MRSLAALFIGAILLAAVAQSQEYAPGFGPNPKLPQPEHSLVPTVNIAPAKSWPAGTSPSAFEGMQVTAFAKDLDHPRWLYVLPNGDVLVAETDAPPRPKEGTGLKAWVMSLFMKRAGSTRTASPNRITLLRDGDGDGIAESKRTCLTGLNSPFGMALVGDAFYVADTDALLRFHYGERLADGGEGR